jgi:hypothetical protein
MIPESQYLFSLLVILLLGMILGILFRSSSTVTYHYRHTWSPDMSKHKNRGQRGQNQDPEIRKELDEIEQRDRKILEEVEEIEQDVHPKPAPSQLTKGQVNLQMKTIPVGGTTLATLALKDQNGAPMTIDATYKVVYAASNPASVTVGTPNADGSCTITGVAADTGNTIGATVTRPDGVAITLNTDTLAVTGGGGGAQTLTSGAVVLT